MGVAVFAPPTEVLRRRMLAGALALAVNAALLALILFLPREMRLPPDEPEVVQISFVTLPPPALEPEPEETIPEPVEVPEPETLSEAETPVPPADAAQAPPPDAERIEEREEEAVISATPPGSETGGEADRPVEYIGEALPFPAGPGSTEFAVREVFCLSTSDGNRDAFRCPPSDGSEGLPMLQFADPEDIARAQAAFAMPDAVTIRSMHGVRTPNPRAIEINGVLSSQGGLATSSSDQMRATLPD